MSASRSILRRVPALALGALFIGSMSLALADEESAPRDEAQAQQGTEGEAGAVEKRLREVEEKLRLLERQREVEQEVAAGKAKDAAIAGAGRDGFFVKSPDGAFILKFRGLLHSDSRFWGDDVAKPATDTFYLRRVRPILEGTVGQWFDFRITPDFGEGKTVLQDAYADWRFAPSFKLRSGKFKTPFGLERLQSASDIVFVERSLPTNLVPNRDLGIMVHGDVLDGLFSYAAGVFNGVVDGGSADADANDSKEAAGRLFFLPFKGGSHLALLDLGIGVAATYGTNRGVPASAGLPSYKTAGQQTFFTFLSDGTAAGTTVASGRRYRFSPQLYWYVWRVGLQAERVTSRQEVERGAVRADLENTAWQATATFVLTDDRPTFKGVVPRRPFDPKAHAWGAFELVARAGSLEVDEKAFTAPAFANPASSASAAREWGAGLNWYLNRNVKLVLDYARTRFTAGAAAGADREDEKVILQRLEIAF